MPDSEPAVEEALRYGAEENLREQAILYHLLMEHASDFIRLHDVDGRSVYASRSVKSLYGQFPTRMFEFAHPEDLNACLQWWRDVLAGSGERLHWRIRDADGNWRTLESSATRVLIHDRPHVLTICRDITEKIQAEEARCAAEQRLQHVVATSPAILFTMQIEEGEFRTINWMSENVESVLGYRVEETLAADWWTSNIHPEDGKAVADQFLAEIFSGDRFTAEYRFRHSNGKYRWIRGETRLLRDEAAAPAEIVGSLSDITERKHLEDQFRQAQKMEALGHLAGGVAHDFNNLLTIIAGYGGILMSEFPENGPKGRMLAAILEAGERAAGLTRQLLAFSRQTTLEPMVLDLNVQVRENEKMLRRLIGEDVTLTTKLAPALPPVKADPGQLDQIIMNLAVNARDAMPAGGELTIETGTVELDEAFATLTPEAKAGCYVVLAVTDTGCGMSPEVRAQIFEPFYTTKPMGQGTGLGLSVVYGIMQQSGGFLSVYSEPGLGTVFKLYFPVARDAVVSAKSRARVKALATGTETILLVEDEDAVRTMVGSILQKSGYTVLAASGGKEALDLAAQYTGPIHLLMTDVVMPEMGGRELVERLAQERPEIKVLYLSGYTNDAVVRHGVLHAEVAFLQKPFTMAVLTNKVRELLEA